MAIELKTKDEVAYMREAALIVFEVLEALEKAVAPGISLDELDAHLAREEAVLEVRRVERPRREHDRARIPRRLGRRREARRGILGG